MGRGREGGILQAIEVQVRTEAGLEEGAEHAGAETSGLLSSGCEDSGLMAAASPRETPHPKSVLLEAHGHEGDLLSRVSQPNDELKSVQQV